MGLLDDAIREHLDLKRRRGADPTEIERAEQEALGPVRRGPEAPQQAGGEQDEPQFAYDHEDEGEWDEEPQEAAAAPAAHEEEEEYDPFPEEAEPAARHVEEVEEVEEEPEPPTRGRARFQDEEPFDDDEPFADEPPTRRDVPEPEPTQGEEPAPPPPHRAGGAPPESAGGETVEYDAIGGEDEDVLEETPEFLQDTPDHDRLWFEQKPPRDFDFNG